MLYVDVFFFFFFFVEKFFFCREVFFFVEKFFSLLFFLRPRTVPTRPPRTSQSLNTQVCWCNECTYLIMRCVPQMRHPPVALHAAPRVAAPSHPFLFPRPRPPPAVSKTHSPPLPAVVQTTLMCLGAVERWPISACRHPASRVTKRWGLFPVRGSRFFIPAPALTPLTPPVPLSSPLQARPRSYRSTRERLCARTSLIPQCGVHGPRPRRRWRCHPCRRAVRSARAARSGPPPRLRPSRRPNRRTVPPLWAGVGPAGPWA